MCGVVAARASGAGKAGVRMALGPLVLVYGLGAQAESPVFWDAYDVLAGVPHDALTAGIRDYLAAVDSQFFPKPGPLKALCDKHAAPLFKAAHRLAKAASLQPPRVYTRSLEQRQAVERMAKEATHSLAQASAAAWPKRRAPEDLPSIAGRADAGGLTPEMRELLAKQISR